MLQEADLESHLFKCGTERVLVLGCHDLNMFSSRAQANMKTGSQRYRRSQQMRELTRKFRPTMILHHPHSTDSPRIWSTAWSGAREFLPCNRGARHVWASGIAYDRTLGQQVLDLPQRQREPNIHHHSEPDDFGRTVEISKGVLHSCRGRPSRSNALHTHNALSQFQQRRWFFRSLLWERSETAAEV